MEQYSSTALHSRRIRLAADAKCYHLSVLVQICGDSPSNNMDVIELTEIEGTAGYHNSIGQRQPLGV